MLAEVSLNEAPPVRIDELIGLSDLESNLTRVSPHYPGFGFRWALAANNIDNSDDAWFALLAGGGQGQLTPATVVFTLRDPASRAELGTYELTGAVVSEYAEEDTGNQVIGRVMLRAKQITYAPAGGGIVIIYPATR